jgi:ferredoxin-NADP reductase
MADDARPVVLLSAGVGVTPVLAMLGALAAAGGGRPVWWVHGARSGAEHAYAAEACALLRRLPAARSHVRYSCPLPGDREDATRSVRWKEAAFLAKFTISA